MRPLVILAAIFSWMLAIIGSPPTALASLGDLDPAFGSDGRAEITSPSAGFQVTDVDVDREGGVLVTGRTYDPPTALRYPSVIRLLSNGQIDPGFGTGGVWTSETAGEDPHVGVLPDGRVILAFATTIVRADHGRPVVRIVALDAEGSPDPSFGDGGTQTIPTGIKGPTWSYEGDVGDITTAPDGDIVIAAIHVTDRKAMFPDQHDVAVIRLRTDGSRETAFAGDGVGYYPVSLLWEECCYITPIDVSAGEGGQISWVGTVQRARDGYEEWQQILTVVRVDRRGRPVATYGQQGVARLRGWDFSAAATSASALDTGAVVVAGRGGSGWGQFLGPRVVVRFGPRGRLDPTFSSDGVWVGGRVGHVGEPVGTWVDRVGRITAMWAIDDYSGDRTALSICRILKGGTLDRTFGADGCLRLNLPSAWLSQGPEVAAGRKLVIAGRGGPTSEESTSVVAVRLLTV